MYTNRFEQPVSIFIGLGFPREVETPSEAFQVLNEWDGVRSASHATALNACRAACTGEVDVEMARNVFEAFARSRGILAPDALAMAAQQAIDEWMAP
jgi:hypothetical protein